MLTDKLPFPAIAIDDLLDGKRELRRPLGLVDDNRCIRLLFRKACQLPLGVSLHGREDGRIV